MNILVSVLWRVSNGNIPNTIRNSHHGLQEKIWTEHLSRVVYTLVDPDGLLETHLHTFIQAYHVFLLKSTISLLMHGLDVLWEVRLVHWLRWKRCRFYSEGDKKHTHHPVLIRYTDTQSPASEVKIQYVAYSGNFLYKHYIMVKHTTAQQIPASTIAAVT